MILKELRGRQGQLGFIEENGAKIWKEHMEKIMNKENEWDHMVETNVVEGPMEKVARNEIVKAKQRIKSGKATGPSEVSAEMIVASGEIGVKAMMELFRRVLNGRGMPDEWKTCVIVPIFIGKGNVMSCGSYREVKVLEDAVKIVKRVLERRIQTLVNLKEMRFGFMPGKGTVDAIFIVKKMKEEYQKKNKKLCISFVGIEKAFDSAKKSDGVGHEKEESIRSNDSGSYELVRW